MDTMRDASRFFVLLAPFLGASPTTSASILVEFGGSDWTAGCDVARLFSHTYISQAVRHTPHTRIQCAAMLACEAPDPLARNTGVRSQGIPDCARRIPDRGLSQGSSLITCADWRGLRVPCAGDSATALFTSDAVV